MSEHAGEHTFALAGPVELNARVSRGSLTVRAVEGLTEARVTITPRSAGSDVAERFVVALAGRTLTVLAPRESGGLAASLFNRNKDAADVAVSVPAGTALQIGSSAADVLIEGRSGSAEVLVKAAQVTAETVDGDLRLRCGSGDVRVRRVSGDAHARVGSGSAEYGTVGGASNVVLGSGNLRVDASRGAIRARTGSGNATLNAVHADVDVVSGSGTVAIGIPAGRPARLDVTAGSGEVVSELPIDGVATTKGTPISIRARAGSGDVRLFRAPVAAAVAQDAS